MSSTGVTGGPRILVVEDDAAQLLALSDRLTREGFEIEVARDGDSGLEMAVSGAYDLLILDIMLPGRDGYEIASEVRGRRLLTPILMLTARGEATDKVVGLELGADDYLTKPYEFIELVARIRALLRRAEASSEPAPVSVVEFGGVRVDFRSAEARRGDESVPLAAKELELLRYMAAKAGNVLTRDELLDAVWGYDAMPTTRTVDVHIARLRQKLEADPANPEYILTVRGLGYKLANCSPRAALGTHPRRESRL